MVGLAPTVVGFLAHNKVYRGTVATLVQPLKEGVLGVGTGHTPYGWAGGYIYCIAVQVYRFAQRLHFQLLQVGHQIPQPKIVWRNIQRAIAQHAAVHHARHRQLHGGVFRYGGGGKMLVHGMRAGLHAGQRINTHRQRRGECHRRPD